MPQPTLLSSVSDNLASLPFFLPEGSLAATLVLVLLLAGFIPQYQHYWLRPLTLVGLALAGFSKYRLSVLLEAHTAFSLFNGLLILDQPGIFFSLLLLGITVPWVLWGSPQASPASRPAVEPVRGVLVLGILLGSCLLVMAFHWLILYLGLTLISLASALLLGSESMPVSTSASLKYLLYSMIATTLMLWGMGYLYGYTGTLALVHPDLALRLVALPGAVLDTVLLLCLSGILFILGATPYHFWLPNVYQGAHPTAVAYLATVPKLAALAALWRLCQQFLPQLGAVYHAQVQQGLAGLALLTLIIGHTAALLQNNLQRLFAYGAIAQGGLLIAGVVALPGSQAGLMYYSGLYTVMTLAAWLSIEVLQYLTRGTSLQDCVGLGRQFPGLGVSVTVIMMALIGLPPTAGFTGKFLLLAGLWEASRHTGSPIYLALLVAGFVGTIFSLYYYLRLPYILFSQAGTRPSTKPETLHWGASMVLGLLAMLLLVAFGMGSRWLPANWLS